MTTTAEALKATRDMMDKAVENTRRELSTIRSGRRAG